MRSSGHKQEILAANMGWQNDERIRCVLVLSTLALKYGRARTVAQFRARMDRVVQHMNSNHFGAGGGLPSLARGLRKRCQELVRLNGERLLK